MKINAQIKVNENRAPGDTEVASGWVEIEDCIKFPVKVRSYLDKTDNTEKLFVSYPQRKTDHGYDGVIYPSDKNVKKEIENYVLESMKKSLIKGISMPPITETKITLLESEQKGPISVRALASIKVAGLTINGIMIKESEKGMFVQMPQHKSGGEYRDTVYGTNKFMQNQIRETVLEAYKSELQKREEQITESIKEKQIPEQKERYSPRRYHLDASESMEMFLAAYESGDVPGMEEVLKNSELEVGKGEYLDNKLTLQFAHIEKGEDLLTLRFQNNSEQSKIDFSIYKEGKLIGKGNLYESAATNVEGKDYQEMLDVWRNLTHQERTGIEKEKHISPNNTVKESAPKL